MQKLSASTAGFVSRLADAGRYQSFSPSIRDLECRAVLRSGLAVIVDPRRGDVRVPEPFLHLGDVSLVVERILSTKVNRELFGAAVFIGAAALTFPRFTFRACKVNVEICGQAQ